MKTKMLALAVGALCACGGSEGGTGENALTAVVTREVIVPASLRCKYPDISCVPRAPPTRRLEDWKLGTIYWPRDTRSAVTIYIQSPSDSRRFRAYGIDLQKRSIAFVVEGSKSAISAFRFQIGAELADIVVGNAGVDFGLWDAGLNPQFQFPPPPPPPHGGNEWLAFKAWNAALDLADVGHNLYSQDPGGFTPGGVVGGPTGP